MGNSWEPDQSIIEAIEEGDFEENVKDLFKYVVQGSSNEEIEDFVQFIGEKTTDAMMNEYETEDRYEIQRSAYTMVTQILSRLLDKKVTIQPIEWEEKITLRVSIE